MIYDRRYGVNVNFLLIYNITLKFLISHFHCGLCKQLPVALEPRLYSTPEIYLLTVQSKRPPVRFVYQLFASIMGKVTGGKVATSKKKGIYTTIVLRPLC